MSGMSLDITGGADRRAFQQAERDAVTRVVDRVDELLEAATWRFQAVPRASRSQACQAPKLMRTCALLAQRGTLATRARGSALADTRQRTHVSSECARFRIGVRISTVGSAGCGAAAGGTQKAWSSAVRAPPYALLSCAPSAATILHTDLRSTRRERGVGTPRSLFLVALLHAHCRRGALLAPGLSAAWQSAAAASAGRGGHQRADSTARTSSVLFGRVRIPARPSGVPQCEGQRRTKGHRVQIRMLEDVLRLGNGPRQAHRLRGPAE